jgi:hypothetical protein
MLWEACVFCFFREFILLMWLICCSFFLRSSRGWQNNFERAIRILGLIDSKCIRIIPFVLVRSVDCDRFQHSLLFVVFFCYSLDTDIDASVLTPRPTLIVKENQKLRFIFSSFVYLEVPAVVFIYVEQVETKWRRNHSGVGGEWRRLLAFIRVVIEIVKFEDKNWRFSKGHLEKNNFSKYLKHPLSSRRIDCKFCCWIWKSDWDLSLGTSCCEADLRGATPHLWQSWWPFRIPF